MYQILGIVEAHKNNVAHNVVPKIQKVQSK